MSQSSLVNKKLNYWDDVHQNLNGSRDLTTPFSGMVAIRGLALATVNLYLPSLNSTNSTHYEYMEGDTKCRNGVVSGS